MTEKEKTKELIVVKIGSGCLRMDNEKTRFFDIAQEVIRMRKAGYNVILVVSGAVKFGRLALGKEVEGKEEIKDSAIYQKYAGVGQFHLMQFYERIFFKHGMRVSQYLLTYNSLSSPEESENICEAMKIDLRDGIVPIINYNDKIDWKTPYEGEILKDNDRFAAKIAEMMSCKMLVILTGDVEGLQDENKKLIPEVKGEKIEEYMNLCNGVGSGTVGGFRTKLEAGKIMFDNGGVCFIAKYKYEILDLIRGIDPCTLIR